MTYNVATQIFTTISKDGKTEKNLSSLEFTQQFGHEEFKMISEALKDVIQGKKDIVSFDLTKKGKQRLRSAQL